MYNPVLLFCYKRLGTLKSTVTALQKNSGAENTELFIFSDGPKCEADKIAINEIRNYLNQVTGFKSVKIYAAETNKGLANSIIGGVSEILEKYPAVIVLEDDLITSINFLSFMNQGINFYKDIPAVFSVSGFSFPMPAKSQDNYFTKRSCSTGWATWRDRWTSIDWEVKDYQVFKTDKSQRKKFNRMGSDMSNMLDRQMDGKINSWAIRWCYHQFKHDLYTVFPTVSKVDNIGFGEGAANTQSKFNRFRTALDTSNKVKFDFSATPSLDKRYLKYYLRRFSIPFRLYSKAREMPGRIVSLPHFIRRLNVAQKLRHRLLNFFT